MLTWDDLTFFKFSFELLYFQLDSAVTGRLAGTYPEIGWRNRFYVRSAECARASGAALCPSCAERGYNRTVADGWCIHVQRRLQSCRRLR